MCLLSKQKRKIITILSIIVICSRLVPILPQDLTICFIDVGQGDCTFITTPKHKKILIDGGGNKDNQNYDVGKSVVLPYLLSHNTKQIDMMFISHFDADHSQGLVYILENVRVKNIVIGKQFETSENYKEFMRLARDKNVTVNIVEAGQKIKIEEDLYIDILWPDSNNIINDHVLNNNSFVCKLNYKNFRMLFTGDIEQKAEKAILQKYKDNLDALSATVLKVAHHGSKTSSTKEFLKAVNPKISVIGVGNNNKFGHPSDITLENLQTIKCRIYRTDEDGEVILRVNKKGKIWIDKMLN